MVQEYFDKINLRLKGLITSPVEELRASDSESLFSVFQVARENFAFLLWVNPFMGLVDDLIWRGMDHILWRNHVLLPLFVNLGLLFVCFLLAFFGQFVGERVGEIRGLEKNFYLYSTALMPFFAAGLFKPIPTFGPLVILLAGVYILFLWHLVYRHVFRLNFLQELVFLGGQLIFMFFSGGLLILTASALFFLFKLF